MPTTYETMLQDRRRESKAAARAILDLCAAEKREMSKVESNRFDSIIADLDSQDEAGKMVADRCASTAALRPLRPRLCSATWPTGRSIRAPVSRRRKTAPLRISSGR